jgi:hypothetical protein
MEVLYQRCYGLPALFTALFVTSTPPSTAERQYTSFHASDRYRQHFEGHGYAVEGRRRLPAAE